MPASARQPMHIGFLAKDFLSWRGGVWFIQNLLCGLASMPPHALRLTIFVPSDSTPRVLLRRIAQRLRQAAAQPSRALSTLTAPSQ